MKSGSIKESINAEQKFGKNSVFLENVERKNLQGLKIYEKTQNIDCFVCYSWSRLSQSNPEAGQLVSL